MKTVEEIRDFMCEQGYEDSPIFVNPDYADAFIGVTTKGIAVYDYNKMVEWMAKTDNMTLEEAAEFIDFNTIDAYFGEMTPIVIYPSGGW